jgi:hypothetical protein
VNLRQEPCQPDLAGWRETPNREVGTDSALGLVLESISARCEAPASVSRISFGKSKGIVMRNTQQEIDMALDKFERYATSPSDKIIRRRREIQYLAGGNVPKPISEKTPPTREGITEFRPAAANRLRRYIDNFFLDFTNMITLTYGEVWPNDGRVVKAQMNAFFERLRRSGWLQDNCLVWWLEFQSRGAPHIHMVGTAWLSKSWISSAWHEVSGAPLETATRVEQLRCADAAGSYASKYAAKSDQKEVPAEFTNVGRFWGCRGARPVSGGPRSPKCVSAATPNLARSRVRVCAGAHTRARARGFGSQAGMYLPPVATPNAILHSVRCYEHEGGWSFYGKEKEIDELWRYLQEITAHTGPTDLVIEDTQPKMSPASIARPSVRAWGVET